MNVLEISHNGKFYLTDESSSVSFIVSCMPRSNENNELHSAALGHGKIFRGWMNSIINTCCEAWGLTLEYKKKFLFLKMCTLLVFSLLYIDFVLLSFILEVKNLNPK